jgi:SAM-dependent methyltransferase
MLQHAAQRRGQQRLVCGQAAELPFAGASFDLVYCVNAIHHFDRAQAFVSEAWRVLRPGGALAVIGMDPNAFHNDRWYIYDNFPGTLATDRARYPSSPAIAAWMEAAGFTGVVSGVAERIVHTFAGREVLADPILQKHGTSQLVLLSDDAYAAGRGRIAAAIGKAEAAGQTVAFTVDVSLSLVTGRKA